MAENCLVDAADCVVSAEQLAPCLEHLKAFTERYAPHLCRTEQRGHAEMFLEGLLSNLRRKTVEPIAMAHDRPRRALQRFVGAGRFSDAPLVEELKRHVGEEIGDPCGALVIDPTCFEKKGDHSVGVARQWNGRIGKEDNCQKAVLIAYAAPRGVAIVDERLYLPEAWADDTDRRAECYVPRSVAFKTSWELALDLVDGAAGLPHAWVLGDEEFGRPAEFRASLRERNERYVLDVPSNTRVRPIRQPVPAKRHRLGRQPGPLDFRASDWARTRKSGAWVRILTREGTKGPIYVWATSTEVETRLDQSFGPRERLVVVRMPGASPDHKYLLTNAERSISIGAIVGAAMTRHSIEEAIQRAKGEAGLAQYEVRSWVGWHHHMTFALLACWFLTLERNQLGGKNPDHDGAADGASDCGAAA